MKKILAFYRALYDLIWGCETFEFEKARKCFYLFEECKAGTICLPTEDFGTTKLAAFRAMHNNPDAGRQAIREAYWRDLGHMMTQKQNEEARKLFIEMVDAGSVKRHLYVRVIKKDEPINGFVAVTIITSDARELQRLLNAGRPGEEGYQPGTIEVIQDGPDIG